MKTTTLSSILLGILLTHAMAASISYEGSLTNTATFSGTVPKFNPAIGTLESVSFNFITTAGVTVEMESENPLTGPATANVSCIIAGNFSGLNTSVVLSKSLVATYGADDEVDGPDYTGVDYKNFGVVTDSKSNTAIATSALASYVGTGSLGITVAETQPWQVATTNDYASRVAPAASTTQWAVVYSFTPNLIPEPSSILLGSVGLLGLMARRRR